jgi:peptidoglycan/LPS O-acetylase OafA/YrhL
MQIQQQKSGYLPGLDGWRAFAILGIMMSHDRPWSLFGHSDVSWKGYGGYGVDLFFAISGVLICTRILEEEALIGQFRIGRFYIRRFFRIQPAAFAYLSLIAVLILLGTVHEHWHFWFGGLFLYQNFLFHTQNRQMIMDGYFTGHFWTLAVEEHFYILLSLFLLFVKKRRILVLAIMLALVHIGQAIAVNHGLYSLDVSTRRSYWVLHLLFFPAEMALLLRVAPIQAAARKYLTPWLAILGTCTLTALKALHHVGIAQIWTTATLATFLGPLSYLLGLWVIATMLHPQSWTTRFLELKPLRFVGRLSYSIYVWHLLFFCAGEVGTNITSPTLIFLGRRPICYIGIITTAMLSYFLIEKPLIRYGHRIAPPSTPGHADLRVGTEESVTAPA